MKSEEREVVGFEGFYIVNNLGEIFSLRTNKKLKPYKDRDGYLRVRLYGKDKKVWIGVHKVVATAFLNNPQNYTEINHLNYIRDDNRVENLEWCDSEGNTQWSIQHYKGHGHKNVICEDIDGNITRFESLSEASRVKQVSVSNICRCCKGRTQRAGGYKWKYDGGMALCK